MKITAIPQLYRNLKRWREILAVLRRYGLADWLTQFRLPFRDALKDRGGVPLSQLTFRFDTNLLMYGVGALIGLRACVSLLIGAVLAWAVIAPQMLADGKIRLEVSETLSVLPPGVVLAAPP